MPASHFMLSRREGEGSGGGVIVGSGGCSRWWGLLSMVRVIVGGEGYCQWEGCCRRWEFLSAVSGGKGYCR